MKKSRAIIIALLAVLSTVIIAGCDDELIDDATFRLWCGDQLCSWKLDAGHVRQAPTWHKNDHGVELIDTPTTISQELKKTAQCLVFTTIADVEPSAQVTVGLDFTGDGVLDYEQPIAATGFREVKTQVTAPRMLTVLPRIVITKKGNGRAVLAQIRLQQGGDCSAPSLRLRDLPLGSGCTLGTPSECSSGVCCEGRCAECCVEPKFFDVASDGGVAPAPRVECAGGAKCERRATPQTTFFFTTVPQQCNPGGKDRTANAICLGDDDCASEVCEGASSNAFNFAAAGSDGSAPRCPSDFPDAGGEGCSFGLVHEGRCR